MPTFMKPYEPQAYALLRIVASLLFIWHGKQGCGAWRDGRFFQSTITDDAIKSMSRVKQGKQCNGLCDRRNSSHDRLCRERHQP